MATWPSWVFTRILALFGPSRPRWPTLLPPRARLNRSLAFRVGPPHPPSRGERPPRPATSPPTEIGGEVGAPGAFSERSGACRYARRPAPTPLPQSLLGERSPPTCASQVVRRVRGSQADLKGPIQSSN